ILAALGRVAAADVVSRRTVPAAPYSAMDGYAVRHTDVSAAPAQLGIVAVEPAGTVVTTAVERGTAVKLFTGSVIPPGADAVVRIEDCEEDGDRLLVRAPVPLGANIRAAGEDVEPGQVVLARGTVVGPADVGVLASVGRSSVLVHQRPRVAILSTGSELVEVDDVPGPGQVVNSNASALVCFALYVRPALRRLQGHRRVHLPVVRARLAAPVRKTRGLTEFVRVSLSDGPDGAIATAARSQSSGALSALGGGAGLLVGAAELAELPAGAVYPVVVAESALARETPPF